MINSIRTNSGGSGECKRTFKLARSSPICSFDTNYAYDYMYMYEG